MRDYQANRKSVKQREMQAPAAGPEHSVAMVSLDTRANALPTATGSVSPDTVERRERLKRPAKFGLRNRGSRGLAAEMRPEFIPRMTARKGRSGLWRPQKAAERFPTLGDIEYEQPLGRDRIADPLIVPAIGRDRRGAVGVTCERFFHEPTRHGLKNIRDMWRQRHSGRTVKELADRHAEAVPPLLFRPFRMHHLGVGKCDRGLRARLRRPASRLANCSP